MIELYQFIDFVRTSMTQLRCYINNVKWIDASINFKEKHKELIRVQIKPLVLIRDPTLVYGKIQKQEILKEITQGKTICNETSDHVLIENWNYFSRQSRIETLLTEKIIGSEP